MGSQHIYGKAYIFKSLPLILLLSLLASCHVGRYFTRNFAGINDYRLFPQSEIAGKSEPIPVHKSKESISPLVSYARQSIPLSIFLPHTKSTSCVIMYRDSLLFEWYAEGFDSLSTMPSFSVAKSVVSSLVGIAAWEGGIPGLDAPIHPYLPPGYHKSLEQLSFRHLLNMEAGLNFREAYSSPFSPMAKYYYGRKLDRYVRKLRVESNPGTEYEYQSAATQLAGIALENAIGRAYEEYLAEKIWKPAGNLPATWNLDREGGSIKFFCCLNATSRDFLRFGKLFANQGRAGNIQVIPEEWVKEVIQGEAHFRDSQGYLYHLRQGRARAIHLHSSHRSDCHRTHRKK